MGPNISASLTTPERMPKDLASGDWHVVKGKEHEFQQRWTDFLEWTKASSPGFVRAILIRDLRDPAHFVSVGFWEGADARNSWQSNQEFAAKFGACRELCSDVRSGSFELAKAI